MLYSQASIGMVLIPFVYFPPFRQSKLQTHTLQFRFDNYNFQVTSFKFQITSFAVYTCGHHLRVFFFCSLNSTPTLVMIHLPGPGVRYNLPSSHNSLIRIDKIRINVSDSASILCMKKMHKILDQLGSWLDKIKTKIYGSKIIHWVSESPSQNWPT